LLLWTADVASGAVVASGTTVNERLVSLLERDVQNQKDERLRNVLEFYRSGGTVPESVWQQAELQPFSEWIPWYDPLRLAKFVENSVRDKPMGLSRETRQFIGANQAETLAAAVRLTQKDFSPVARMAADVLMQYRDQLTAEHWENILEGRQYVFGHRESYPAGIHARADGYSLIPLGYVFIRSEEAQILTTETKVHSDGKQMYPSGTKGLGWRDNSFSIGFGRLSVGPHTLQLKTTYEFRLGDVTVTGVNTSPECHVEITAADTPDHLAAEVDEQLIAQVEAALVVGSTDEAQEVTYSVPVNTRSVEAGWSKSTVKIVVPAIKVTTPLPVSLCMNPEIYVEGENRPMTRLPWVVPKGRMSTRILENWVPDPRLSELLGKTAYSEGRLPAKLVLRPSRAQALSEPPIQKYYPKVIEREIEFRWAAPNANQTAP
jgi:hypothetical protein